jgi:hypothetical protein
LKTFFHPSRDELSDEIPDEIVDAQTWKLRFGDFSLVLAVFSVKVIKNLKFFPIINSRKYAGFHDKNQIPIILKNKEVIAIRMKVTNFSFFFFFSLFDCLLSVCYFLLFVVGVAL